MLGLLYRVMLDRTDEELENMIKVNFTSMIYTIRAFLPSMLDRNFGIY
ncbi:MAG: hypothetical protein Ct9H90mP15_00980 [Candidatus Neomarinimicrobiota bacterium]|nr:MAG: hypothetical protein Ct9H90mP15_00980 [Candidatus Neomarinimicrobiota bacterium]